MCILETVYKIKSNVLSGDPMVAWRQLKSDDKKCISTIIIDIVLILILTVHVVSV